LSRAIGNERAVGLNPTAHIEHLQLGRFELRRPTAKNPAPFPQYEPIRIGERRIKAVSSLLHELANSLAFIHSPLSFS
jgi:hypothetical protein